MPVTVKPSGHESSSWTGAFRRTLSPESLLNYTLADESKDSRAIASPRQLVQSSFEDLHRDDFVFATKNGFVHSCMEAYNQHHCLVLRPEDVWFAILTQLQVYVNAHADEMRETFVGHEVQKELHIDIDLEGHDQGKMALLMTKLMQESIKDEGLQEWFLPVFTTTTEVDQAVASVIFMGSMQKYFTYSWGTRCGLPAVTLLGEMSDWIKIRQRADRLSKFGPEP